MSNLATNNVSPRRHTAVLFDVERREGRAKGRDVGRGNKRTKGKGGREGALLPPLPHRDTRCGFFDRAGEAGRKVEKTVSITPGTHRRIICWGWVNCDLRSVMTCNNFLSLLSVSRRGRSPRQGEGCTDRREKRKKKRTGSWMQSKQMREDILCNVGSGNYNQINYWYIKAIVNAVGEYRCWCEITDVRLYQNVLYRTFAFSLIVPEKKTRSSCPVTATVSS